MIKDEKYTITTQDHMDAVIYVCERSYDATKESEPPLAVIPIHCNNKEQNLVEKVETTCRALADVYSNWPDSEIYISYSINAHPFVN